MISKYDLLKHLERETLRKIERDLQFSYQDLRELLLSLHRQLNASMGCFETDQEIYDRYIKNNEIIQKFNTRSKGQKNIYWDAVTYNNICKKRLGIDEILSFKKTEWFRDTVRSDPHQISREFDLKCLNISSDEWEKTRENLTSRLNDFTKY